MSPPSSSRSPVPRTTFGSGWRAALLALLAVGALVLGSGVAAADAPFRIPGQITDENSSLGNGAGAVQTALTKLQTQDNVQLWVVFVSTFSGASGQDWANASAALSGFGSNTALLAVATGDRAYGLYYPNGFPLSQSQLLSITQKNVEPLLSKKDWSGAAIATADGMRSALGSSGSGSGTGTGTAVLIVIVLLVILVVGYLWFRSRRRSGAGVSKPGSEGAGGNGRGGGPVEPEVPVEPLEPLESVSDRSVQQLIATDNAVRSSEQQLILAEATFGAPAMVDFRAAFENARTSLATAFQLRQQIDDEIPEDEATHRAWMAEIIQRCTDADDALDAQTDRFDAMLDVKGRLPAALADLDAAISTQQSRVAEATGTLARLSSAYAPSALGTVISNAAEASGRLDFADDFIKIARNEATAVDTAPAIVSARGAQEAIAQVKVLLDAIDTLDAGLADAAAKLPGHLTLVQNELAAAKAAFGQGSAGSAGPEISARLRQVETSLTAVTGPNGARDPILATQRVREADATLDDILAATRGAQDTERRASAALGHSLDSAQAKISSAGDFIDTRRGAVGSQARTRLAEAQRHLSTAQGLADVDAAKALAESRQAETLADEASRLAQNDVGRWQGPGGGGFGAGGFGAGGFGGGGTVGGSFAGAILGGVLGGLLSGGGSGHHGGFGGGGFGGFGGSGFGGGGGGGSIGGRF